MVSRAVNNGYQFWWLFALVVVVLVLGSLTIAEVSSKSRIVELIRHDQLGAAEQQLWDVLSSHPDQVWALELMGELRVRQNRDAEAEALFHRILQIDPSSVDAQRSLGTLYQAEGKAAEAIAAHEAIVKIAPHDRDSNLALATVYERTGKYQESVAAVERVPLTSRPPSVVPLLADDYFKLGQPDKVPLLISQVLRLPSGREQTALDLVAVLLENGYVRDASKLMQAMHPLKPDAGYLHVLARVREAEGRKPEARQLLAEALRMQPKSFDILFDSARIAAEENRWKDSLEMLRRADAIKPNDPAVLMKLAVEYAQIGETELARLASKRLYDLEPENPDAQYVYGRILHEAERFQEILDPLARKMVAERPNDPHALFLLGMIEYDEGNDAESRQDFTRSLDLDPKNNDGRYYLALLDERDGNFDEARNGLQEVVRTDPNHAGAQQELGVIRLRQGDVNGARAALEIALKLRPDIPQTHYQLGLVYARLGMADEARRQTEIYEQLHQAVNDKLKREILPQSANTKPAPK
ncbi:MAG TPA: tetratricopeptide repeat protein [Candidatus Sulfotelmatobacter sp.]|nr:tetratricopeptide repeat protein [Candidatus Sulfotelmatobacter sp.]